jgi:tetratricopeptide (TPR) repeat protein
MFTSTVLIEGMQPGESLSFEQLIARSEEIARQSGRDDLRTRIFATDFLANWYRANGLYRNAEAALTRTIESLPPETAALGASLRCARADLWSQLGRAEEALATLTRELAANIADDAIASECLLSRAGFALNRGDADAALDFAQRALNRFEVAGVDTVYGRSDILQFIGAAHGLRDEFGAAHAKYREALELLTAAGRGRGRAAANVREDWSSVWLNAGNPRRALEETDAGWDIIRGISPAAQISDRRIYRRARILGQLGRSDEALAAFEQARTLASGRGNVVSVAGALIGEADVYAQLGRSDEASKLLDAALVSLQEANLGENHVVTTRYLMTRAAVLAGLGRPADARNVLTQAIRSYESQGCCRAHIALAHAMHGELALATHDVAAAADDAAKARALAPKIDDESFSRFTGRAWYLTGLVYEQQRKLAQARDAFATAAVQCAGSLGDKHAETLRVRAAMTRVSNQLALAGN